MLQGVLEGVAPRPLAVAGKVIGEQICGVIVVDEIKQELIRQLTLAIIGNRLRIRSGECRSVLFLGIGAALSCLLPDYHRCQIELHINSSNPYLSEHGR